MSNSYSEPSLFKQDGEIDVQVVINQIRENKWLIILVMMFTLSCGVFYSLKKVPQYASDILLQIKSDRQSGSGVIGKISQQLNVGGSRDDPEVTQIALIKSRYILAPVVESLGLDILAAPKQSRLMSIFSPSKAKIDISKFLIPSDLINQNFTIVVGQDKEYSLYDPMKKRLLRGKIGKVVSSKDGEIQLQVDAIDASPNTTFLLRKKPMSNVVQSLKSQLQITDLGSNKYSTGVLSLTLNSSTPEKAIVILNEIGKIAQAKDIQKNAIEASKTLEFLYQQLPITKHDLDASELALNRYRAKSGKIDMKLQTEYLLRELIATDKQLSELRIQKIDMLQRYTLEHPFIHALSIKIRELKASRKKLETQLRKLPESDQVTVNLMRDVNVKNALYMVLLGKIQELQVVKAGIVSDVRIISSAKSSDDPLPQHRIIICLASLIVGLLLSLAIIFVRRLLNQQVDDPHWSERHFNLVNLAVVPYSKEQTTKRSNSKDPSEKTIPLLAHINPRNLSIEALRNLRTSLQVRLSCTTNNIVAILGVSPSVGKTFISANLAYLLAASGKRVVIIDTDMRRGTLQKYFDLSPSPGLAEVLNNKTTLEEAIAPTMLKNLMVLPRGTYPDDPSELLTGEAFKNTLTKLSEQFDIVVVDTPPVLLVTDAVLIGMHAGTNYLVLGAGAHHASEIEVSIKHLTNAGVTLNGSVFNFQKQSNTNAGGYKYNYYYDDKENHQKIK
jgi:tyrosine-protein kinase Etk/Wzc